MFPGGSTLTFNKSSFSTMFMTINREHLLTQSSNSCYDQQFPEHFWWSFVTWTMIVSSSTTKQYCVSDVSYYRLYTVAMFHVSISKWAFVWQTQNSQHSQLIVIITTSLLINVLIFPSLWYISTDVL